MRKHFLQMLSLILVLVMVVSLIPAVYATEAASQTEPTEEATTSPTETETEPELSPEILESRQIPAQYTGMEDYIPGFDDDGPTLFRLSSTQTGILLFDYADNGNYIRPPCTATNP